MLVLCLSLAGRPAMAQVNPSSLPPGFLPPAAGPLPSGVYVPAFLGAPVVPADSAAVSAQAPGTPAPQPEQPKNNEEPSPQTYPHKNLLPAQYLQRKSEVDEEYHMPLELPGLARLTRRESEKEWQERIRQEAKTAGDRRIFFPDPLVVTHKPHEPRRFDPHVCMVEPSYVVHQRLLFEQINLERYGWDLGVLTPVANVAVFYYDMFTLPYHIWSRPLDQMDTSAGKYLPGDNAPLMIYPESFSLTGLAGMAGTYLAGPFIFR